MFCEFCGKRLEEGESCSCQSKGHNKRVQFNGFVILSFILFAAGSILAYYLIFIQDNLLAGVDAWKDYYLYIAYIIPAAVWLAGFIVACISLKNRKFKKGSIAGMILNFVFGAAVIGLLFFSQYKVGIFMEKVVAADADTVTLKDYYDETLGKDYTLKEKTLQEMKSEIDGVAKAFQESKLSFEEAEKKIENIKNIGIVTAEADSALEQIGKLQKSHEAFSKAGEYETAKDYKNALLSYNSVIKADADYGTASEKVKSIRELVKTDAKTNADGLLAEKKYAEAFQTIDEALKVLESDDELEKMKTDNEEQYVEYVVSQTDKLIGEKKISEADQLLEDAGKVISRSEITDKSKEVDQYKPVNLEELRIIDKKYAEQLEGLTKDSYGNEYNNAVLMKVENRNDPADFFVNVGGRYSFFTATIAPFENMATASGDDPSRFRVEAYADGSLIYTSDEFLKTTAPAEIRLDIGNAKVLQIRCQHINKSYSDTYCVIGNGKFSNE